MNQGSAQFGAHEMIGMNEALMTKSANVEMLSFLTQQVQDPELRTMLSQQAQFAHRHFMEGVNLLQSQGGQMTMQGGTQGMHHGMTGGMNSGMMGMQQGTMQYGAMGTQQQGWSNSQPKLGLRNPSMPAPTMDGTPSDRSIAAIVLNMHKFGAISWTTLALECAHPQLRTYLMQGASECDRMAYETWSFMNQKGFYQVPTLLQKTEQTMIHAYQMPNGAPSMQGFNGLQ